MRALLMRLVVTNFIANLVLGVLVMLLAGAFGYPIGFSAAVWAVVAIRVIAAVEGHIK